MKKILAVAFAAIFVMSAASAYNPPVGAENFNELTSAEALAGKVTVTGGPIFSMGADSVIANPALLADAQRVNLNVGYTFMYGANELNNSIGNKIGNAFQTGIIIPWKYYIFTGYVNGMFIPCAELPLGDMVNLKAALSKQITDRLNVGLDIYGGYHSGSDWALGADLGFLFKHGDLGPFKNFRYGASVQNLGKNYLHVKGYGSTLGSSLTQFPQILTLRGGAAGTIFKNNTFELGLSLDITTPCFQNLIFDLGAEFRVKDMLSITVADKINLVESVRGVHNYIPSIGLSFRFTFDVKNNEYLARNDWSESEMTVNATYKNLYKTVHAASASVDVDLGMKDTTPPQIILINMEEE